MTSFSRRKVVQLVAGTMGGNLVMPSLVRAQESRELVVITYPGRLSEPHRWLADQIKPSGGSTTRGLSAALK